MININFDSRHNILFLKLRDYVNEEELNQACRELKDFASGKKDFVVVTDLEKLSGMGLRGHLVIDEIMEVCASAGVKTIIRLIPDQRRDIGFTIMSCFHYSPKVKIVTLKNHKELTRFLEKDIPWSAASGNKKSHEP